MERRGFLRALGAVALAPFVPWRKLPPPVGGIDRATFAFWRNTQQPSDPEVFERLRASMRETYNNCTREWCGTYTPVDGRIGWSPVSNETTHADA